VLWGLAMTVNLAWPRTEIYNATPPYHWYLRWSSVLFVAVFAAGGFAYYWFVQRHKIGVLADHAAVAVAAPASSPSQSDQEVPGE
jgi:hypothetical protein